MKPDRKKNIDFVLHDIRRSVHKPDADKSPAKNKKFSNEALVTVLVIAVMLSGVYGVYRLNVPEKIISAVRYGRMVSNSNASILDSLIVKRTTAEAQSSSSYQSISSSIKEATTFFKRVVGLLITVKDTARDLKELKDFDVSLVFNNGGEEFLTILERIHSDLSRFSEFGIDINTYFEKTNPSLSQRLSVFGNVSTVNDGLGAVIDFLEKPGERKMIILFENQSEIRPTGGFPGSYGEVTINKGNISDIKVNDIYYPDRRLELNVVPPIQLQTITVGWGARDAGWFFDFPTSAEKTLELLEASDIYVKDETKFDGVVALNANVVEGILGIIGPIDVPEKSLVLTKDNFLREVRNEVEASRAANPKQNPKKILSIITPTIINRISKLDDSGKAKLLSVIFDHLLNKDIKIYVRDAKLEKFINKADFGGRVLDLPDKFIGDYLAVVNANVAGGKTDIFIDQSINLKSRINANGLVNDKLTITRHHSGEDESQWFYRSTNQNFVKIFTVPGAVFESATGTTPKKITPQIDYKEQGYIVDPVLSAIENTRVALGDSGFESYKENGKNVFASWFSTPLGETKTLSLNYSGETIPKESGMKYRFVFEKQSGVESKLTYSIDAPPGFIWLENNSQTFSYSNNKLPARLNLTLTLIKNG